MISRVVSSRRLHSPVALHSLAVVFVALACSITNADERDAATPGERLLPDSTLAVATIPDANEFRRRWNQSSLGAMADDPAFHDFLEDVKARVGGITEGFGINLLDLWDSIDGELTVGLIQTQELKLSFVAVADFGTNSEAAATFVKNLEDKLKSQGGESTSIQAGSMELRSWSTGSRINAKNLAYCVREGQVAIGENLSALSSLNLSGESDPSASLAGNADYRHVIEHASPGSELAAMQWYVNPTKLLDAAVTENIRGNPNLPLLRSLIDAAGLKQFRAAGGTFQMAVGGLDNATTTYGYIKQPVQGILQAFEMPATEQHPPDWVKDGVSLYAQINWGPARLFDTVAELVDRIQGAGTFDRLVRSARIGQSDYSYGDLIDQMTGPLHITAEIPANAEELINQSAIIAFDVRNPRVAADIIGAVMSTIEGTSARHVQQEQMYEVELPSPLPGQSMRLGLTVAEGSLMLSTSASYLEQTLRSRDTKRALADSRAYQRIAERFPKRTSMISFQRQDGRFEGLYEQLRTGSLGLAGAAGLPSQLLDFDFEKLPSFSAMSRYLQSTGGYIAPAEDGFRIVNFALPPREQ